MLTIDREGRVIPDQEYYDYKQNLFVTVSGRTEPPIHLQLEHSLMSLSKWESKWHVPFMDQDKLTPEQFADYVRCMTINPQKDPKVYDRLNEPEIRKITDYIADPMSAYKPKKSKKKKKQKDTALTSESIYYMMIQFGIPFECEKWHLNRLQALIDVCAEKDGGGSPTGKKMSPREQMNFWNDLNNQRRKQLNSKG